MKANKIIRVVKATQTLVKEIKKAFSKWKAKITAAMTATFAILNFTACGVTKAHINNKAAGTTTTITITTNNPITTTTDANPQTDVKL